MGITKLMIIINVLIFILVFSMPESVLLWIFSAFAFTLNFEIWRIFTSLFLHANASHLFFNMLGLYFFGKILEEEINNKKWLMIYFLSGIIGNLLYGLTSSNLAVGASACVFGLMGAVMLLKPEKIINFYIFPLPLGLIALLFSIFTTMLAVSNPVYAGIAHVAHVGGLATGGLITIYLNPKRSIESILILIFFIVLLAFLGPIISLITGVGSLILGVIEKIVGFILYGISHLLRLMWIVIF